ATVYACADAGETPDRPGGAGGPRGGRERSSTGEEAFSERARELGIDFTHFNGMFGEHTVIEAAGAGGGLLDFDHDGDLDVYLVQGCMFDPHREIADALVPPRHPLPLTDRLYRNELSVGVGGPGSLGFTDVTERSAIAATGYGMGVTAGDYDNDGWIDLYLTNYGPNQLLRNNRDGTFEDVTARSGTGDDLFSVPALFFDYDRDGWLDLFVGNYVYFPLDDPPECRDMTGGRDYCGPDNFAPQADRLLHNRGDGSFAVVTETAGLTGGFGPALGAVATDLDGDGWPDLYVANDGKPNNFWANRGDGTFADRALMAGLAVNADGQAEASMGVDAADYDRDGDLDLFMTHFITETNTLYENDGSGMFVDRTNAAGLGAPSRIYTSFGTAWVDYDNDSRLDLFVVNGAVNNLEALVRKGDPFPLHQPNQLFRGLGDGRYEEVEEGVRAVTELSEVSRGAVFGDLDNDGDTDVLVLNNNGPARLLINNLGNRNPWIGFRLLTGEPPRDAFGARLALLRDGREVLWERMGVDGSYCSANDPRLLIGLGAQPEPDGARVYWPDGTIEEWSPVASGRYTTLRQGTGQAAGAGA
ncbi:MAG: CRTAC1 family protein, partial [Thermoanaerobaculia bacterium]